MFVFDDIVVGGRESVKFDLVPEIVDRIVFAMEDQGADYSVDVETAEMVKDWGAHLGDRFVPIPPWRPIDGFQLMERFVPTLRNPIHRGRLRDALNSRGRVFRTFKDELRNIPSVEQLWYRFKMAEMRRIVTEWYELERRSRGLARLGPEPEETDDLVASEFAFGRAEAPELEHVARLHGASLREASATRPLAVEADPDALVMVARGSRPGIVGFIGGVPERGDTMWVGAIAVAPEFRGLGIGRALLSHFIDEAARGGFSSVEVELCDQEQDLEPLFVQQGFSPVAKTFRLPLAPMEERKP